MELEHLKIETRLTIDKFASDPVKLCNLPEVLEIAGINKIALGGLLLSISCLVNRESES